MVGVGLRSFVLTVDIYSAVNGATNIAQDWASGNLGWHNTMDALAILPVLSYGAGRLMRGGPNCFIPGTGVVMMTPMFVSPETPAGFTQTASGLLLPVALAVGAVVGYAGISKDEEEDEHDNPKRQRGKKQRGVGFQPAKPKQKTNPMDRVLREIGEHDSNDWLCERGVDQLALDIALSQHDDESSVGRVCNPSRSESDAGACTDRRSVGTDEASTIGAHSPSPKTEHQKPKTKIRNRCAAIFLCIGLSLSGFFFWQHLSAPSETDTKSATTTQAAARTYIKIIEEVKLGERTAKPSGKRLWMKLVWSLEDMEAAGATEVGATIDFEMPEMGAVGPATVTHIGPTPPVQPGPGNLVTGLFKHEPDRPVGCTGPAIQHIGQKWRKNDEKSPESVADLNLLVTEAVTL